MVTRIIDAWFGSFFSRTTYLGKSQMDLGRSERDASHGLVGFYHARNTLATFAVKFCTAYSQTITK